MEEQVTKLLEKINGLVDVIPQVYEVVRKQYVIHNLLSELIGALMLCAICVGGVWLGKMCHVHKQDLMRSKRD